MREAIEFLEPLDSSRLLALQAELPVFAQRDHDWKQEGGFAVGRSRYYVSGRDSDGIVQIGASAMLEGLPETKQLIEQGASTPGFIGAVRVNLNMSEAEGQRIGWHWDRKDAPCPVTVTNIFGDSLVRWRGLSTGFRVSERLLRAGDRYVINNDTHRPRHDVVHMGVHPRSALVVWRSP